MIDHPMLILFGCVISQLKATRNVCFGRMQPNEPTTSCIYQNRSSANFEHLYSTPKDLVQSVNSSHYKPTISETENFYYENEFQQRKLTRSKTDIFTAAPTSTSSQQNPDLKNPNTSSNADNKFRSSWIFPSKTQSNDKQRLAKSDQSKKHNYGVEDSTSIIFTSFPNEKPKSQRTKGEECTDTKSNKPKSHQKAKEDEYAELRSKLNECKFEFGFEKNAKEFLDEALKLIYAHNINANDGSTLLVNHNLRQKTLECLKIIISAVDISISVISGIFNGRFHNTNINILFLIERNLIDNFNLFDALIGYESRMKTELQGLKDRLKIICAEYRRCIESLNSSYHVIAYV